MSGSFAADPRSRELLDVALRLKLEAQMPENEHVPIQILPSINVQTTTDQDLFSLSRKEGLVCRPFALCASAVTVDWNRNFSG